MRTLLLVFAFLVFILTSVDVSAQYMPLLKLDRSWHTHFDFGDLGFNEQYLLSDTVIFDSTVYMVFDDYSTQGERAYELRLREDSTQGKVYFSRYDSLEFLLYDFTLSPGDTFAAHCAGMLHGDTSLLVLDSIRPYLQTSFTVENYIINTNSANYYYFTRLNSNTPFEFVDLTKPVIWQEGTGSLAGILNPTIPISYNNARLMCYVNEAGAIVYHNSHNQKQDCLGRVWGSTFEYLSVEMKITPNPSSEYAVVSCEERIKGYQIRDVYGRAVSEHISVGANAFKLTTSSLPNGVYYLFSEFEKGVGVSEIVVSK